MKMKTTILFILFLGTLQFLAAQDRIYFVDKTIVDDVRIEKVEDKVVVYYEKKDGEEVRKEVHTRKVSTIIWEDGTKTEFVLPYADPALYVGQGKNGFKIHLLAPLLGHTAISYEQNIRPGRSLEYTVGIIGLGTNFGAGSYINSDGLREDFKEDQKGAYVAFGYRKYSAPSKRANGRRYKHLLQGWYLMPKIILGAYNKNEVSDRFFTNRIERRKHQFGNLMLYAGKQIVFFGSILLDWQVGMGIGVDSDQSEISNHYTVSMVDRVSMGGGIRLGVVF